MIGVTCRVFLSAQLTPFMKLTPGRVNVRVAVDDARHQRQQLDHPACSLAINMSKCTSVTMAVEACKLRSKVAGMYHRGWQMFEDGTLLLVVSKTDTRRMTLQECLVSRKRQPPVLSHECAGERGEHAACSLSLTFGP